ncbi:hypothetical protein ABZ896_33590 [Streptomyces sp. NPDC047072]|uniref:hypothetical protein n=1 Tax=Streptomyces sp. NPDC047072 TaxID=3154809 RepID=UPI0033EA8E35
MRRHISALALTTLTLTPTPAQAAPATCTPTTTHTFPLKTRIHSGPPTYDPGGGYGTWYLDLTNTTPHTCTRIHPVVVLVDKAHTLKPSQPRLEFYDGPHPRPVHFEPTDEDELVGAFGGPGLTVAPGKTRTVKIRLALTSDTTPNEVTATSAVVQKHGDDGDWVGESNDYRFTIDTDEPEPTTPTTDDAQQPNAHHPEELAGTGITTTATALTITALLLAAGTALRRTRRR